MTLIPHPSDRSDRVRPEHTYTVVMHDNGGGEERTEITVAPGLRPDQEQEAHVRAQAELDMWVHEGSWGDTGAAIRASYELADNEATWPEVWTTIETAPDHAALIRMAVCGAFGDHVSASEYCGNDPDDHEWSSADEGGCAERPGVWSLGGMAMEYRDHCRVCGLRRHMTTTGSQHNPSEHNSVEYEMPVPGQEN